MLTELTWQFKKLVSSFKLWWSFCSYDFRLQKGQGAQHRTQLFSPDEMHADKQGPHRECQIGYMEGGLEWKH